MLGSRAVGGGGWVDVVGWRRVRSGRGMTRMMRSVELARSWRPEVVRRRRENRPVLSLEEWRIVRVETSRMLM